MGMFSDYRQIKQTAKQLTPPEHRGVVGGFRAARDGMATANQALQSVAALQESNALLGAAGRPGQATVTGLRDTGTTVNDNPYVELDLLVAADGLAPYPATISQVVSRIALPQLQPGCAVRVRIDPVDQQRLVLA
jgi:hypothetical protein